MKRLIPLLSAFCLLIISNELLASSPETIALDANISYTLPDCPDNNYNISVSPSGGVSPYTVTVNGQTQVLTGQGETAVFEISGPIIEVHIIDDTSEEYEQEIDETPNFPTPIVIQEIIVICESEVGVSGDGSIEVVVSGGSAPYLFEWSAPPFTNFPILEGLSHQEAYAVTITDANNCMITQSGITVGVHDPIASTNAPVCQGDTLFLNGTVSLHYGENLTPYWTSPGMGHGLNKTPLPFQM